MYFIATVLLCFMLSTLIIAARNNPGACRRIAYICIAIAACVNIVDAWAKPIVSVMNIVTAVGTPIVYTIAAYLVYKIVCIIGRWISTGTVNA